MIKRKKIIIYNVRPTLSREGYERSDYPSLDLAAELRRFRGARIAGGRKPFSKSDAFLLGGNRNAGEGCALLQVYDGWRVELGAIGKLICKFRLRYREG